MRFSRETLKFFGVFLVSKIWKIPQLANQASFSELMIYRFYQWFPRVLSGHQEDFLNCLQSVGELKVRQLPKPYLQMQTETINRIHYYRYHIFSYVIYCTSNTLYIKYHLLYTNYVPCIIICRGISLTNHLYFFADLPNLIT